MDMFLPNILATDKKVPQDMSLPWVFTDKPVTAWGGLRLVKEMLIRMNFREALTAARLPQPQSNRGYEPVVMIESFMVSVWVGGVRFSHTALVRFDEALRQIFAWKRVASVSTFTRFFRRFRQSDVTETFGYLHRWFWGQIPPKTLTLDLDSSVITRYGEQEGAAIGYNPAKRGRPSHHPLFAFVADLRMTLHAWLRPGNTSASNNVGAFFEEALSFLGDRHRVALVRADSGFFGGDFLKMLESKFIRYIVAVRMNPIVRSTVSGLSNWVSVDEGIAVSEMSYQAHSWGKARRVIVVRQDEELRPQARGKLLLDIPGYRYQLYVTDLDLAPAEVWRIYRSRADSENRIGELKMDFGLSGFCLDSFWATEAAFHSILLAYNIMSLFRQAVLQAPKAVRLLTMRFQCFALGAWVGRKGKRKVLRIHVPFKRRAWFEGLFSRLREFQAPWPVPG